jgi:hypothetical protein
MRKVTIALIGLILGAAISAPAHAATHRSSQSDVNWAQRDTAVYVVSTLNLLHTSAGQPMTDVFKNQFHVKRYVVEADAVVPDLYFIDLLGKSQTVVGVFAYKMGWQKPQVITDFTIAGLPHASADIVSAYRTDHHTRVATFRSTLPS